MGYNHELNIEKLNEEYKQQIHELQNVLKETSSKNRQLLNKYK